MRQLLLAGAMAFALPVLASADPVYVGLSEAGVNGGNITTEVAGGANGIASFSGIYGTFTSVSALVIGSPALTEPDLDTTSIDVSTKSAGTLKIYVSELGQTTQNFTDFVSGFTSNIQNGSIISVTEATYAGACGAICTPFLTTNLLSTATFSAIGSMTDLAPNTITSKPYWTTEVFTITAQKAKNELSNDANDSIDLSSTAVPEPVSLSMLGLGLVALGAVRRRRA
jgi:hypothetical protein